MNDPVKNNACAQEFAPENIQKVPAMLCMTKGQGFLHFNIALANFDVLAAHLLKSDQWIYGLYYGPRYFGYVYHGDKLTLEQQMSCVRDFLPADRNELLQLVKQYSGRIDYHLSETDAFTIIGEYEGKKVIQKPKKFIDNQNQQI